MLHYARLLDDIVAVDVIRDISEAIIDWFRDRLGLSIWWPLLRGRAIWASNLDLRRLVERVYVLESKRIGAIAPTPAFRTLMEGAIKRTTRSDVILASREDAERVEARRWWRRGRLRHSLPQLLARCWA